MGKGVEDEGGFADDFFFWDLAPGAAVAGVIGVIAHGVEVVGFDGDGVVWGESAGCGVAFVFADLEGVELEGICALDGVAVAEEGGFFDFEGIAWEAD